ncbi:LysR family transcriptional regulator [Pseudomonas aeruginosa]|nr:LysR family transcriptional regulator [Pseudomonas aeruginosa]
MRHRQRGKPPGPPARRATGRRPVPAPGPPGTAEHLLRSLQQAFELIGKACDELRDPASQSTLRLAETAELAQKWLVGRLADFSRRHPHVTLHLYEQAIDAGAPVAEIDVAITYGTGPADASDHFVRPLPPLRFFPVCSPGLFNQGDLRQPADLARHCLLHDDQDGKTWTAWLATHAGLALEAAALGQGVTMGDNLTCQGDLAGGRLVRPFAASVTALGQYALVCERLRLERGAVAEFVEWFGEQLANA